MQAFDPNQTSVPTGHFLHGALVGDAGAETMAVRRPSDGQVYAQLPLADEALVDRVVEASWKAWRSSDWARRASVRACSGAGPTWSKPMRPPWA